MKGTVTRAPEEEDWAVLLSFLPKNWQELAEESGALRGLRKDKSPECLLRTLLIHLGCGHSLRETVIRARQAQIADLSAVALFKRLKKSRRWLHAMCVALFQEHGVGVSAGMGRQMRAFDATHISEPGRTGSLWRLHYSITLPALGCDFFNLTATKGKGTGESLKQFPIRSDDYILVDRGYATALGIQHVETSGGYVTVRVNTGALQFETKPGQSFDLLASVESIKQAGKAGVWTVFIKTSPPIQGRICALRKADEAIQEAEHRILKTAKRKGHRPRDETLRYARYVILFTTFPVDEFSENDILEWYRLRWQVELVFKRFKSLAQLGHLPKLDEESSQAWLYGKLMVALLTEKIVRHARTFSPWGYPVQTKCMERL